MSSMTKEQLKEFSETFQGYNVWSEDTFDWLNKNHFDYRDLISRGQALNAVGLNIY
jgi:hypothetical protein